MRKRIEDRRNYPAQQAPVYQPASMAREFLYISDYALGYTRKIDPREPNKAWDHVTAPYNNAYVATYYLDQFGLQIDEGIYSPRYLSQFTVDVVIYTDHEGRVKPGEAPTHILRPQHGGYNIEVQDQRLIQAVGAFSVPEHTRHVLTPTGTSVLLFNGTITPVDLRQQPQPKQFGPRRYPF